MRQKDLAAQVGIESSTLVRLIDALDEAGLIERQTDEDRRAKILCLTRRGRSVVKQVEAAAAKVRQRVLADVTDKELAVALDVIDRVCAALTDACSPGAGDEL